MKRSALFLCTVKIYKIFGYSPFPSLRGHMLLLCEQFHGSLSLVSFLFFFNHVQQKGSGHPHMHSYHLRDVNVSYFLGFPIFSVLVFTHPFFFNVIKKKISPPPKSLVTLSYKPCTQLIRSWQCKTNPHGYSQIIQNRRPKFVYRVLFFL